MVIEKAKIGKELKKDGMSLIKYIESLSDEDRKELMEHFAKEEKKVFTVEGKDLTLSRDLIKFEEKVVNVMEEKYVPHVVEPAFGIGRLLQAIIEHSFN